jgi:hypothetical protein
MQKWNYAATLSPSYLEECWRKAEAYKDGLYAMGAYNCVPQICICRYHHSDGTKVSFIQAYRIRCVPGKTNKRTKKKHQALPLQPHFGCGFY